MTETMLTMRELLMVEQPGALRYALGLVVVVFGVFGPLVYALTKRKGPSQEVKSFKYFRVV
ncbi:hypothetical protein BSKO_05523 [Bryopsis sp. KO-2023]|nr:hypothetical protein BSKO_05523 [Bryopsis sp. KO-2023]